jgi:hypothetical protein
MAIRRINFLGGACCGKSTIAPYVYSQLKMRGLKVSLAQEYVKEWAYLKRDATGFDQLLVFANQLHKEELPLKSGEDIVVSESPLFLSACYAQISDSPVYEELFEIVRKFEEQHPSINIFLNRKDIPYASEGRYGDADTAKEMDVFVKFKMEDKSLEFEEFNSKNSEAILEYVLKVINNEKDI